MVVPHFYKKNTVSMDHGINRNHYPTLRKLFLALVFIVVGSGSAVAASFEVDGDNAFDLGSGTLDLECADLILQDSASFNADSGSVLLSGDWTNLGTFNRGSSSVVFNDDCGAASISILSGGTSFYNLTASTRAAHELVFTEGQYQSVANALVLTGAEGQLLKIRSTTEGLPGFLELAYGGSQSIAYVDVQDNHANLPGQYLAPNRPSVFRSIDNGGNFRWFRIIPIPTLSAFGLLILVLLLIFLANSQLRTTQVRPVRRN